MAPQSSETTSANRIMGSVGFCNVISCVNLSLRHDSVRACGLAALGGHARNDAGTWKDDCRCVSGWLTRYAQTCPLSRIDYDDYTYPRRVCARTSHTFRRAL